MRYLLVFLLLLVPLSAFSEDDIRAHVIDSKKFVCFDEPSALKVLNLRLQFPKLERKITLLEEKLGIKNNEIALLQKNTLILQEKLGIIVTETIILQESLEQSHAWYRSPWVWFGVGLVTGGAIALGGIVILN